MNKHDLIQKVKTLEGISQVECAYLIELINTKKKYGLVWEDKPEDVEETLRQHLPVLQEVVEKRIIGKNAVQDKRSEQDLRIKQHGQDLMKVPTLFDAKTSEQDLRIGQDGQDFESNENNQSNNPVSRVNLENPVQDYAPNHTLIEGDNLHALTALTFTHENKIDVIYIDPPYNTGREDEFRYNDKWILKDNPFRHSSWLSFILKRLKIAKRLLSDTGVMIVHIDEHEFDALNLLLETEIFTEESFLGVIVWNKQNPKGDAKEIASMHEYVLVYAKNIKEFKTLDNSLLRPKPNAQKILNKAKRLFSKIGKKEIPEEIKEVIRPFNFPKEILKDFEVKYDLELVNKEFQAWINRQDFSGGEKAYKFIDENGKVWQSVSMAWPNKEQAPDDYLIPLIHPITSKPCPIPSRGWRNPSSTMKSLLDKKLIIFGVDENTQPRRKYLLEENMYENTPSIFNNGASDDDFFNELKINFAYPKPVEAAKYFLQSVHPNPATILDFFAGSGTMRLSNFSAHKTLLILCSNGKDRYQQKAS
jgi:adenine-specific DNA-methyltransferase